jgi:acetyl-CoA acyltransferase
MANNAVIIAAVRSPIARAHAEKGAFRDVRADDLSADIMVALLKKANLPGRLVEDIHWGCVRQEKEQAGNVARVAALIAGLPIEVGATTAQRNCGSSLQALHQAAMSIAAGCEDVQIAGGVEHMDHLPMDASYQPSPRYLYRHSPATIHMGLIAENMARKYEIGRRAQDEWALRSHQRAVEATERGEFADEIVPVMGRDENGLKATIDRDQGPRRETSLEALAKLSPVFDPAHGSVTAGNASPLNVGAAAMLVMSDAKATELGLKPLARVKAMAVAGVDPSIMGIGPVPAVHKALARAGLTLEDIDLVEINEAFAVQTLACIKVLGLNPDKVNVRGGAIALGHPLGASGARIATTLIHALKARNARYGLATMCIGGGQGIATILERTS